MKLPTLYHYTCDHARAQIIDQLLPAKSLMAVRRFRAMPYSAQLLSSFIWLTDLTPVTVLNAQKLGLDRVQLLCDRTRVRYRVTDPKGVVSWLDVREHWLATGRHTDVIRELEIRPGAEPWRWFVSAAPIPVVLDMHRKEQAS
jgi:hypothetical protein